MTDQVIIDAAARFARKTVPAGVDPLWTRTPEETRAMFAPSVKSLPFVSAEWKNDYWPDSMWVDVPTDNWRADRKRGEHFARLTIGALMADRCSHSVALSAIFQAIGQRRDQAQSEGRKGLADNAGRR